MITVLFATHNGADTLPLMLDAFTHLEAPDDNFEVVAVDNASDDSTREILSAYAARLPLKYLFHPLRGKNRALNAGLAHARGDLIVLTDDDVVPEKNWLVELRRFASMNPHADLFGGRIVAAWPSEVPKWMLESIPLAATYGVTPSSVPCGAVGAGLIWGANMMVRRCIFDSGYRFREDIGPSAGNYAMGSETEFTKRLEADGHRAYFTNNAVVAHIIRPHQLTKGWILRRAIRHGRGGYMEEFKNGADKKVPHIMGVPRWRLRRLLETGARAVGAFVFQSRGKSARALWEFCYQYGYFQQARLAKGDRDAPR